MTHGTLGPMMYEPNVFTLNLNQMLSGKPLDAAIGVLQVTVRAARGIQGTKIGGGTPDPYISLSINHRAELARTKIRHNTYVTFAHVLHCRLSVGLAITPRGWNQNLFFSAL